MQQDSEFASWIQFFKDASVPQKYSQIYANKFVENRIRFEMLSELDRSLLNELGITAIGDCLSIIKHAKIISQEMAEKAMYSDNEIRTIKNKGVAKRIIESCISKSPSNSDSDSERTNTRALVKNGSNNLSADLNSRLNFNPKQFNNENTSSTVRKRKMSEDEEMPISLEYRGFLKNTPDLEKRKTINSKIVSLNNNKKRVLSLEERIRLDDVPIHRRISMEPKNPSTIIRLNNNIDSITRTVQSAPVSKFVITSPKKPLSLAEKIANKSKFGVNEPVSVLDRVPMQSDEITKIKPSLMNRIGDSNTTKQFEHFTVTKSLVNRIGNANDTANKPNPNKNITITLKNELATKNRQVVPVPSFSSVVKRPDSVVKPVVKISSVVKSVSRNTPGNIDRDRGNLSNRRPNKNVLSRISF